MNQLNGASALALNFAATIEQLAALGYENGDLVYFRAIGGEGKAQKFTSAYPDIPQELTALNRQGYGIYVVVNGGGHKDSDVKSGRAIFYEHDNLSKAAQTTLWEILGLPAPSFQVDTGGKSIHSYWVLERELPLDQWRPLQANLLTYAKGDPSIKNPSRVMRLAGFDHQGTKQASEIVSNTNARHDPTLLAAIIAPQQQLPFPQPPRATQQSEGVGNIFPIPLVNCLAKTSRTILAGVSEGGRNSAGAQLARDLIGTENYLDREGIDCDGDARLLFESFARACTPPLSTRESERIWQSAERSNPRPSCPPEAIDNILMYWRRDRQQINPTSNYQQINNFRNNGSGQGVDRVDKQFTAIDSHLQRKTQHCESSSGQGVDNDCPLSTPIYTNEPLSADLLKREIVNIFERRLPKVDWQIELVALASKYKISIQSVKQIYESLENAASEDVDKVDNIEIDKILLAKRRSLAADRVLPKMTANKLEHIATARGINSEPMTLGLLVACSSVAHAKTKLDINNYGDVLSVYPNLFGMVVAESGSLKSPTINNTFTKPLRSLQDRYSQQYQSELAQYRVDKREWDKNFKHKDGRDPGIEPLEPRLTVTIASDTTIEKLEEIAYHQPEICPALYRDEIIGIFQAFEKHGGKGGGDAISKLLSYYDGGRIDTHRMGAGSRISLHDFHPAVFGGIQPEVLQNLARRMGMDNDGTLCRFLYAPLERTFKEWDTEPNLPIVDILAIQDLVQKVHNLPAMECRLDRASQLTWAKFANHYNRECLTNPRLSPWLKHAYSKAVGQLAKISLTLHLIECASVGRVSTIINSQTIERAAIALDYFISQAVALIANTEETLASHLVRVLDKAKKYGTITPRQVQQLFSGKKRIDSRMSRNYLQQLATGGYGTLDAKWMFTPKALESSASKDVDKVENVDRASTAYQHPEPHNESEFLGIVDNVDKYMEYPSVNLQKNSSGSKAVAKVKQKKPIEVGDRVCFMGTNPASAKQYAGDLKVYEVRGAEYTCQKPDGTLTSWIQMEDLRLVS